MHLIAARKCHGSVWVANMSKNGISFCCFKLKGSFDKLISVLTICSGCLCYYVRIYLLVGYIVILDRCLSRSTTTCQDGLRTRWDVYLIFLSMKFSFTFVLWFYVLVRSILTVLFAEDSSVLSVSYEFGPIYAYLMQISYYTHPYNH